MTSSITVGLGERAYEVVIAPGLLEEAGGRIAALRPGARVAVVADPAVNALHGAPLLASLTCAGLDIRLMEVGPGEASKSFAGLAQLCDNLLDLNLDRTDLVVAFGGGVVGDLAGFAAAIYKRGIDFIQLPTTLLAQVDSSVGGKTAIDTARGKNLVGAFHQPILVLADLDLLATLPSREVACGYAEILKYAVMGDVGFFAWLETQGREVLALERGAICQAVRRSVEMKAQIVAGDEREVGARALLNFGHTFAHALEAETGFSEALKHGEAVGLGCALAFRFSARLGLCRYEDAARVCAVVAAAGLPTRLEELAGHSFSSHALIGHMARDKKARSGGLTFILARGIGEAFVADHVDLDLLNGFLISEGTAE